MAQREEWAVQEKEDLKYLLEDLLMRVQEEFTIALEDLADMIKDA